MLASREEFSAVDAPPLPIRWGEGWGEGQRAVWTRVVHGFQLEPLTLALSPSSFVNRRRQKHYGGQESTMEDESDGEKVSHSSGLRLCRAEFTRG